MNGATLAGLAARGTTWTVGGVQAFAGHPWTSLGIVILGEFGGPVFASVARGFREEIYLATRYHLRRFFRVLAGLAAVAGTVSQPNHRSRSLVVVRSRLSAQITWFAH